MRKRIDPINIEHLLNKFNKQWPTFSKEATDENDRTPHGDPYPIVTGYLVLAEGNVDRAWDMIQAAYPNFAITIMDLIIHEYNTCAS